MTRAIALAAALGLALAGAGAARAGERIGEQLGEDGAAPPRYAGGIVTFTYENDMFADTDRYYTSGHRAAWQSRGGAPDPLATVGGWLAPWLLPRDAPVEWGVALGQTMYTSRRRLTRTPPRDDRPYAAHLGAALSLQAADETSLGVAELSLGVIGPLALGEQVQDLVHDAIGVEKLGGWGHQIGNRPAALLSLERRWRLVHGLGAGLPRPFGGELQVDVVPAFGVNLGNVQTSGAASLLLRLGQGLAMDFGPPRMRPALSGLAVFRPPEGLAWYLYAGAEGRAIGYDATLDGNRNGYWRVDRRPLVGELLGGVALAFGPLRLDGTVVVQSPTFDEQSTSPHVFTATSLSVSF